MPMPRCRITRFLSVMLCTVTRLLDPIGMTSRAHIVKEMRKSWLAARLATNAIMFSVGSLQSQLGLLISDLPYTTGACFVDGLVRPNAVLCVWWLSSIGMAMKTTKLNPNQIITLNDYPLYSNDVLSRYLDRCRRGEDLPLVPVIGKDTVRKYLSAELSQVFVAFEEKNPAAEYFMLDGSHRTTALALSRRTIAAVIYETDSDVAEARRLVATGQILENETLDLTVEENCEVLNKYFAEKPYFMTVQQKADKLIQDNYISPKALTS